MEKTKQISLAPQFKNQCKQILRKQPDIYLVSFIRGQNLQFNTKTFKVEDMPLLEVLFTLPFKSIKIFQQEQIVKKYKSTNTSNDKQLSKPMVKKFHQTPKFYQLLSLINHNLVEGKLDSLRTLRFQNIPIHFKYIKALNSGLQKSKFLKQLCFIKCSLTDPHLQSIKSSLSINVSLNKLDLSFNQLKQIGGMIGNILSQHGRRKNEIKYMYSIRKLQPQFDLGRTGIYELNLQGNLIDDKSALELINYLNNDKWTKWINLRSNKIGVEGIEKFVLLLKNNSVLMNLDLRENQGMTKQYSKLIFQKLMRNIQRYNNKNDNKGAQRTAQRQKKQCKNDSKILQTTKPINGSYTSRTQKNKIQQIKQNRHQHHPQFNSFRESNKLNDSNKKHKKQSKYLLSNNILSIQQQSNYRSQRRKLQLKNVSKTKDLTTLGSRQMTSNQHYSDHKVNKNHTVNNINQTAYQNLSKFSIDQSQNKGYGSKYQEEEVSNQCKKCRQMHFRAIKAQKQCKQLELQLLKLKNFVGKNVDLSVIGGISSSNKLNLSLSNTPQLNLLAQQHQSSNFSTSFNKINILQNQQEWFPKIQNLMSELTKIMQIVELNQNTQNTIQNALQNINSLSKTVSLYEKAKDLNENREQIQEQILNLQEFRNNSVSIIQTNKHENNNDRHNKSGRNNIKLQFKTNKKKQSLQKLQNQRQ